jgi:hypothetical protein
VFAFIEPPQGVVIKKILRHNGRGESSTPRAPPVADDGIHDPDVAWKGSTDSCDEPREVTFVDRDTFWATF